MILKYNIFNKTNVKEKHLLALELAEVKEIADMIFKRLNRKISILESIEASIDEKIKKLENFTERVELLTTASKSVVRHDEIIALGKKGMKSHEIAERLGIPIGEVELILNLMTILKHTN